MQARVIALGQAAAGDDGVGVAVLEALRARGVPAGVELARAPEDVALISLLETRAPVVLVDAVLARPAGEVLELGLADLERHAARAISTHGIGVPEAVELARTLAPGAVTSSIRVVAVTIERPTRYEQRLSPAVAAALPRAVERVLALVEG